MGNVYEVKGGSEKPIKKTYLKNKKTNNIVPMFYVLRYLQPLYHCMSCRVMDPDGFSPFWFHLGPNPSLNKFTMCDPDPQS